ncbi:hypothetical protein DCO48_04105 [Pseudomonas sp. SDI]|nr:hypothetical protein DCO48_04105 [Pseudomonas sp. SDI]
MSKAEQQRQRDDYLALAHETATHNAATLTYLHTLYVKARRQKINVWQELSDYRKAENTGVTGPSIKSAFRSFVGDLQGNRCCYCRRWLMSSGHAKPIEHILPKEKYPRFSVDFWNLAVACTDCNLLKKDADWGSIDKARRRYPDATEFGDFYHPRFHRYNEHVSYRRTESNDICSVSYNGHTPQGQHLCHQLLYRVAARENLYSNIPSMAKAMTTLQQFQENHAPGERKAFERFRKSLDAAVQRRLDKSAADAASLNGKR